MQFKDKEMQDRLEEMNAKGLTFESLVSDLNVARVALMRMISQETPDDATTFAKDVANIVSQLSRSGDSLLKTAEKLKLVVTKEQLESMTDKWVNSWSEVVIAETNQETFNRIVDRWRPKYQELITA